METSFNHLPSRSDSTVGVPWRLLSFSGLLFGFAIFIYLGMILGYKPFLNAQIKNLDDKIKKLNQSVDESQQKQVIGFYSQLVNIQNILKMRQSVLPTFDLIEKNTYSSVSYSNLAMNSASKEIKLDATAPDYETLVKEITLWDKAAEVRQAVVENIAQVPSPLIKGKKNVKFTLRLILN